MEHGKRPFFIDSRAAPMGLLRRAHWHSTLPVTSTARRLRVGTTCAMKKDAARCSSYPPTRTVRGQKLSSTDLSAVRTRRGQVWEWCLTQKETFTARLAADASSNATARYSSS